MANLLTINGVSVKAPKEFTVDHEQIDGETSRNAAGKMKRDRIAEKVKLSIAWGALSDAEISRIYNAISGVFFSVTYPDPKVGGQATKTFYSGTPSAPTYSWHSEFAAYKWEGLSVNLIEQ